MLRIIFLIFAFTIFGCTKEKKDTKEVQIKQEVKEEFPDYIDMKKELEFKPIIEIPKKPTIRDIQLALKNAGFYTGKIDGIVGPKTLNAIKEFQAKNNLKVDGKVGPKTWEKLKVYLDIKD